MPLSKALMAKVATIALSAMGDIVEPTFILVKETTTHDPLTATNTKARTSYTVAKVALVRFNLAEIGAPLQGERGALLSNRTLIEASDFKAIFRQAELPAGVAPRIKDYVTIDGVPWEILGFAADPADATWTLQLRAQ